MNLIPDVWAVPLIESHKQRLARVIAFAETAGDPLGELPGLRADLELFETPNPTLDPGERRAQ